MKKLEVGTTAHFKAFDVTVRGYSMEIFLGEPLVGIDTKVCATGESNPVSWSPWALAAAAGADMTGKPGAGGEASQLPFKKLYPRQANLKKGECAEGVVPVFQNGFRSVKGIHYANSLNDEAIWTYADRRDAGTLKMGETAHFKDFDVTLRGVDTRTAFVSALDVKVCALSANPVSWEPWHLLTFFGRSHNPLDGDDKSIPANKLYPRTANLQKGECAEGLVPLIDNDGEGMGLFQYANALGQTAVWR